VQLYEQVFHTGKPKIAQKLRQRLLSQSLGSIGPRALESFQLPQRPLWRSSRRTTLRNPVSSPAPRVVGMARLLPAIVALVEGGWLAESAEYLIAGC